MTNTYTPIASVTPVTKEWGFYRTLDKGDRILVRDFDKFCFVNESTIKSSLSYKTSLRQAYFEAEILEIKINTPLIMGLAPSCNNVKDLISKSLLYLFKKMPIFY